MTVVEMDGCVTGLALQSETVPVSEWMVHVLGKGTEFEDNDAAQAMESAVIRHCYHRLTAGDGKGRRLLESLTYSNLGDWIARQQDGVKRGEGGAEDRLAAALELQKRLVAIMAGEPPLDIFVRWKSMEDQPIGWEPDINDGVRLNIRPFMADDIPGGKKGAGILRAKPNIHWRKDRGKEPYREPEQFPWFWRDKRICGRTSEQCAPDSHGALVIDLGFIKPAAIVLARILPSFRRLTAERRVARNPDEAQPDHADKIFEDALRHLGAVNQDDPILKKIVGSTISWIIRPAHFRKPHVKNWLSQASTKRDLKVLGKGTLTGEGESSEAKARLVSTYLDISNEDRRCAESVIQTAVTVLRTRWMRPPKTQL